MESAFVKFKKILKEDCSYYKTCFNVAKREYTIAGNEAVKQLSQLRAEKTFEIDGTAIIGSLFRVDKDSLEAIPFRKLLYTHESAREYNYCAREVQKIINSFDNEKAINYIENMDVLLSILISFVTNNRISISEATQVLGAAIYFNFKKARKHKDDPRKEHYSDLSKYFNADGTFAYVDGVEGLYECLKNFVQNDAGFMRFEASYDGYKSDDFFLDIVRLYLEFYRDFPIMEYEECIVKSSMVQVYPESIRKYYKDGKLISIPEDIQEFLENLKELNVSPQEIRYILSLIEMEKAVQLENNLRGFYENDEAEFISTAEKVLENMKPYEANYYEIKEILVELQTLEGLFISSENDEDRDYILEEKDAYIVRLRILIVPEEEIEPLNIAFLCDTDGETYFNKDLADIDKSIRKRVDSLILKINNDNKRNFREVYSNEVGDMKMYEVVNPNLHIIFTELPGNVYLIIGVATTGKGYREIPYRLANGENRQNIAEIIEAIKDVKIKRKYLAEQNSKIPSFTDKRTRK